MFKVFHKGVEGMVVGRICQGRHGRSVGGLPKQVEMSCRKYEGLLASVQVLCIGILSLLEFGIPVLHTGIMSYRYYFSTLDHFS